MTADSGDSNSKQRNKRRRGRNRSGGSGAAFGAQVLRFSSIHSVGILVTQVATLGTMVVAANFLEPAEFGTFGLLLFLTALLNTLFNLASKQGTLKRAFGADDDEDDEDDDEEAPQEGASPRALGTGLILTLLISTLGTGIALALAPQIADVLGTGADRTLVTWAAAAGGFAAIHRLASMIVWMERRPIPSMILEALRPVLMLAVMVPLLAAGAGIEGAIAATAIGTGIAAAVAVAALWGSAHFSFDLREAATIMRLGSRRIPVVTSMFTINYSDIFILSFFVAPADLGIYQLASRSGFLISFFASGIRRALRPLRQTTTYQAVEAEYGHAVTGGVQLGYFFLALIGLLLATVLLADTLVQVAPASYSEAASLIPLLSAGLAGPTVFRMINKSTKIRRKRRTFIASVVLAALMFIGFSLLLIPPLGLYGAPVAMLIAFAIPSAYVLYRSQTGRRPIAIPYRMLAIGLASAAVCAAGHRFLAPPGVVLQILTAVGILFLWVAVLLITRAVPRYHWATLFDIGLRFLGRSKKGFDAGRALGALGDDERHELRMAIVEGRSLDEIAGQIDGSARGDGLAISERLVGALRQAAESGGGIAAEPTEHDARIGEYLFSTQSSAERDASGRRLVRAEGVQPGDLHELEAAVVGLKQAPDEAWRQA